MKKNLSIIKNITIIANKILKIVNENLVVIFDNSIYAGAKQMQYGYLGERIAGYHYAARYLKCK